MAQRIATRPVVSDPSRVVRSVHAMARLRASTLEWRLMDRLASSRALASTPTTSSDATGSLQTVGLTLALEVCICRQL